MEKEKTKFEIILTLGRVAFNIINLTAMFFFSIILIGMILINFYSSVLFLSESNPELFKEVLFVVTHFNFFILCLSVFIIINIILQFIRFVQREL